MNYVIVTTQWCEEHGVSVPEHARKSLDGTKVIFHDEFIRPVMTTADFARDAQDVPVIYSHDDQTFREILSSAEWSEPETESPEEGDTPEGEW